MFHFMRHQLRRLFLAVMELCATLAWPLERTLASAGRLLIRGSEALELLAAGLSRLTSWLILPGRLLTQTIDFLVPTRMRETTASVGNWLLLLPARIVTRWLQLSEKLNLDRPLLWFVGFSQPLWRPVAAIVGFVYAWFVTRSWRQAAGGLPAVLMILPFAVVGASTVWYGSAEIEARYSQAVQEALLQQDYDRARLYEKKLAQLGFDTNLSEYRTALTLADLGKGEEAFKRMQRLAPENQPGYPQAHYWIARELLEGRRLRSEEESLALAKVHLDHLNALGVESVPLELLRANWLVRQGRLAEAADALEPIVHFMPVAAFHRMQINLQLQRLDQARQDARTMVSQMEELKHHQTLAAMDYQRWLAAEELLGSGAQLRTILERWLQEEPENREARLMLARRLRQEAAHLLRAPLPDAQQVVERWLNAAELTGDYQALTAQAIELLQQGGTLPVGSQLFAELRESPDTPATVLTNLGTAAAVQGELQQAEELLRAALEKDDSDAVAWNNYALVLGKGDASRLEEALAAVNRALAHEPQSHRFRETRGQILLKMNRWRAAIEDLEYALNGLPELVQIHDSLAVAYQALGHAELARLHREHSE